MSNQQESGVVLMAVVIILLPVVVTVGAFTATMTSRTERLVDEVFQEKALLAAESGVDLAIWAGSTGQLRDGQVFGYQLGPDTHCSVTPVHLLHDGADNDGDGSVDEFDEDVYQIVSRGTYRDTERNVAAYLGPLPRVPLDFPAAITVLNPNVDIDVRGTPYVIGYDTNLDGSRADPSGDVPGIAMATPGTLADLQGTVDSTEGSNVVGLGGSPSLVEATAPDINSIATQAQNSASNVLTNSRYGSVDFGNGLEGRATMTYRDGDLAVSGTSNGAGIMVVTGDLTVTGTFRFDGVVIVLGDIWMSGTVQIYGAMVQGGGATSLDGRGTIDVRYSTEALALANQAAGVYVSFNGWQELAR